jgi:hypothetical protein
MEAFAIPDARERLREAVDAVVDESIDDFSTRPASRLAPTVNIFPAVPVEAT